MSDIYLLINGAQEGPYTEEQARQSLVQGLIPDDLPAWHEGLKDWTTVGTLLDSPSRDSLQTSANLCPVSERPFFGKGPTPEYQRFLRCLEKAKQEDPVAQVELGVLYTDGLSVPVDFPQALMWFHRATGKTQGQAEFCIGTMYLNGLGVTKDVDEVLKWYRRASDQNNASAQHNIASMYYMGIGVEKDLKESFAWYQRAADQGDAEAQYKLLSAA